MEDRFTHRLYIDNHIDVLDYVLLHTKEFKDYYHIKEFFCDNNPIFPEKDDNYLQMILNKLQKDGYVDFFSKKDDHVWVFVTDRQADQQMSMRRNIDGNIFLKEGGYLEQQNRLQRYKRQEIKMARKKERNELRLIRQTTRLAVWTQCLFWGTVGIVLATLALVFVELFGKPEPIFEFYPSMWW